MAEESLEQTHHPRSVAIAWWLVTAACLGLLAYARSRPDWPYATSREEVSGLFWLVAVALPGLFALTYGQRVAVDEGNLIVRLGLWGLIRKRIPLGAVRVIKAVEAESMADFSAKETGGHGRGMTCYYTQGRHGIEVITDRKRYFISSRDPERLVTAVKGRMAPNPRRR